jgi:uncharacterized protein YndB with AHSA1/START domain
MNTNVATQHSVLIKPSTVRFERLLPGPVERVWAYLVESKKRALWLAEGEFDLRLGGKIELIFNNDELSGETGPTPTAGKGRFEGRITRLEPLRALAHTWKWEKGDSDVSYELIPKGKDVLLVIQHRLPEDAAMLRGVGGGWEVHTGILEDQLKGVKPRAFWTSHAEIMKELEATFPA